MAHLICAFNALLSSTHVSVEKDNSQGLRKEVQLLVFLGLLKSLSNRVILETTLQQEEFHLLTCLDLVPLEPATAELSWSNPALLLLITANFLITSPATFSFSHNCLKLVIY